MTNSAGLIPWFWGVDIAIVDVYDTKIGGSIFRGLGQGKQRLVTGHRE
jgi:hypothetical protein